MALQYPLQNIEIFGAKINSDMKAPEILGILAKLENTRVCISLHPNSYYIDSIMKASKIRRIVDTFHNPKGTTLYEIEVVHGTDKIIEEYKMKFLNDQLCGIRKLTDTEIYFEFKMGN